MKFGGDNFNYSPLEMKYSELSRGFAQVHLACEMMPAQLCPARLRQLKHVSAATRICFRGSKSTCNNRRLLCSKTKARV